MVESRNVTVETSVISYQTAWTSTESVICCSPANSRKNGGKLEPATVHVFVSEMVLKDAEVGDPEAARIRLDTIAGLKLLTVNDAATDLCGKR